MGDMTGQATYISFKGTVISGDFTEWKDSGEMGVVEATSGADTFEVNLTTYRKGGGTFKANYQGGTTSTDVYNLCVDGAAGTLIVGVEGTATNKPKKTVNDAIVTKRDRTTPFAGVVELEVEFKFNAAPTDGAW